jgi:hypothetical protein
VAASVNERDVDNFDWGTLVAGSVHPIKVEVIEAMRWIGVPMSATALSRSFDGAQNVGNVAYHVKKMAGQGVLKRVRRRQIRGALETFYELTGCG